MFIELTVLLSCLSYIAVLVLLLFYNHVYLILLFYYYVYRINCFTIMFILYCCFSIIAVLQSSLSNITVMYTIAAILFQFSVTYCILSTLTTQPSKHCSSLCLHCPFYEIKSKISFAKTELNALFTQFVLFISVTLFLTW